MRAFFETEERVKLLTGAALMWKGTPFMANSDTPGPRGGVSCQKLIGKLYEASGFCAPPVPEVPMGLGSFSQGEVQLLVPFMRQFDPDPAVATAARAIWMVICQEHGLRVKEIAEPWPVFAPLSVREPLSAGDLLGFVLGRIAHHCGLYLGGGTFIHAYAKAGCRVEDLTPGNWGSRMWGAWRPMEI